LIELGRYSTIIFDCDGVLLNSNHIKTEAFYETVEVYGKRVANKFVQYHQTHGGISRYDKFDYFVNSILGLKDKSLSKEVKEELLNNFSSILRNKLSGCEISDAIAELKTQTLNNWLVISGSDEAELRNLFKERDLTTFFEGGIFGSPDDKITIIERELNNGNISSPAIFFGDAKYDFDCADLFGIDFVFCRKWTDFADWKKFQKQKKFKSIEGLEDLLMQSD